MTIETNGESGKSVLTVLHDDDDIGMESDIEKCATLIMKSWKRQITAGTECLSQERIRKLGEKENYKCLRILEVDIIKQVEMKE